MFVIDWLQTSEFIRENAERFILYCLCGCLIGVSIILTMVSIVLYVERRQNSNLKQDEVRNDYQIPRNDVDYNDIVSCTRTYLPIYRYDGRTNHGIYQM